jgi:hypothetical protein
VVCWFELESAALDDVGGVGFDVAYVPAGEGAVEDGRIRVSACGWCVCWWVTLMFGVVMRSSSDMDEKYRFLFLWRDIGGLVRR